MTGILADK